MKKKKVVSIILFGLLFIIFLSFNVYGSSGTFTICPSGCDYASLFEWEAGEQADLTGTGPCIANITEGFQDTTPVTINGWITTPDDYIKIVVDPTARHHGAWNTSAYIYDCGGQPSGFDVQVSYVWVDGIQFFNDRTYSYYVDIYNGTALDGLKISNCIFDGSNYEGNYGVYFGTYSDGSNLTVWNSIFYGFSDGGIREYYSIGTTFEIYNVVVYDCNKSGMEGDNGIWYIKNSVSFNNTDDFEDVSTGSSTLTYTASDDGDCDDATCPQPVDWSTVFVDWENGDLHLLSTDTDLKDSGTDLSGLGLFTDDIDGETRTGTWDIGADEYYISGEPPQTCTEAGGTCKDNLCNTYTNCSSLIGTCATGYCCLGNCTSSSTCSPADTNGDDIVSITEIMNYISQWKSGSVTITALITGIGEWKNGC